MSSLTPQLEKERKKIQRIAESAGLDFFETVFELVTYQQLNEIASCGGFPVRYPHWRWGMEYERISKNHEYGLSKIYELVINNDPCYAYLMDGNELLDQKLVMAHVYGHSDFFKNNQWFQQTDRKMLDTIANHATKVRKYQDTYGIDRVEDFIDKCLSIENLIDRHTPHISPPPEPQQKSETKTSATGVTDQYMDPFLESLESTDHKEAPIHLPKPEKDVLQFLIHHAPLENWQRQILSIIRKESYYFSPQGMTKIMNEGWASLWHSKMMTESIMCDHEIINFADRHSGAMVMTQGGFNPYKVGIELFRNIQERWDKGQFGREWDECQDSSEKARWDKKSGQGLEKIYQVRRDYNDVTFIDEFLTEEFCIQNKLFVYKFNPKVGKFEIDSRDFKAIKSKLLFQLTNLGQPIINIIDANFESNGGLLLNHLHEGIDMEVNHLKETLKNIHTLWKKPVHIVTVISDERKIFRFDGQEHTNQIFPEALVAS